MLRQEYFVVLSTSCAVYLAAVMIVWSLSLLSHFPQKYVNFSTCHENDVPRWWFFTYKFWV